MKNKIAIKLILYFTAVILTFSVIIGIVFIVLFKNNTISLNKKDLENRAVSIAETLSDYIGGNTQNTQNMHGMGNSGGLGMYLMFLSDIAGTSVWVVDENLNLLTNNMHHGMMSKNYEYSDLPENAEWLVKEVFNDKVIFSEDFSGILFEQTLTVGAPIKNTENEVIGVVLLHSPVNGVTEAVFEGGKLLLISILAALALALILALKLSKNFTDPIIIKEAEDALRLENIRREFVANISHELKTPITVIRGSLEALTDKIVTDPVQIDEYHRQMLTETVFLQRLVGDLLDLSRLQNNEFVLEKTEISVTDCLNDAIRSVSRLADSKNVSILTSGESAVLKINGDYGRIRQMFLIVLDNAVKFSPENCTVEVIWLDNILEIHDYGIGISEEDLPYIFDRFYKSRSEQNKTGTGLGLAIAKQISERHDIKISAQSNKPNTGTSFIFNFNKVLNL